MKDELCLFIQRTNIFSQECWCGSKMGTSETGLEVTPLCLGYEREEGEEG